MKDFSLKPIQILNGQYYFGCCSEIVQVGYLNKHKCDQITDSSFINCLTVLVKLNILVCTQIINVRIIFYYINFKHNFILFIT